MALFNEILAGRYNRFLQKLLQLKGRPPAPQLATEITPAFDVEDLPVELRILCGWNLWIAAFGQTVGLGLAANSQFKNPAGSGVVAVLESIFVGSSVATQLDISTAYNNPANLTNLAGGNRRDSRIQSALSASVVSSQGGGAELAFTVATLFLPAGAATYPVLLDKAHQWPILPGTAIRLTTTASQLTTTGFFLWRERPLEDSEVTA